MPFGIQPWHIVVIIIVALIIFGPSKLPELGRSIGKAINEFRVGAREMTDTFKEEVTKGDSKPAESEPTPPVRIAPPEASVPYETPPAAAGVYCTQCGTLNPADARFCKSCGKPLVP
jgi:sec-independent protein translocase protein TatA